VSRRPTKAKEMPVQRPTFRPCWTEAKAVEMTNDHLAPDAVANVGYRLAMVILARPAEDLMRGRLHHQTMNRRKAPLSACPASSRKLRAPLRAAWKS
jgi:hypothetical protein